jgi:hypothetical protein
MTPFEGGRLRVPVGARWLVGNLSPARFARPCDRCGRRIDYGDLHAVADHYHVCMGCLVRAATDATRVETTEADYSPNELEVRVGMARRAADGPLSDLFWTAYTAVAVCNETNETKETT